MVISSRAIVAMGLSAVGLGLLVGPSLGQQQDGGVRRTASPSTAAPTAPITPVIGTIDMDAVFKNYDKVKVSSEEFKAAALARKGDLQKIQADAQQEAEILAKLTPGTEDFKKHENRVTELKARFEAGRESAERDFASREAEAMATLYKEVQAMVARIAKWRKMTYIVKVSNQPISGSNPNSVMAAMANTMVYADPTNDITNDVVYNLNRIYKATGGPSVKGSATTTPPATSASGRRFRPARGWQVSRIEPSRQCGAEPPNPVRPGRAQSRSACQPGKTRHGNSRSSGEVPEELNATPRTSQRTRPPAAARCHSISQDEEKTNPCLPPSVRNARLLPPRKCAGSGSFMARTSHCGSTLPNPTPAWFSFVPTSRIGPPCPPGSAMSCRRYDGRQSSAGRLRSI